MCGSILGMLLSVAQMVPVGGFICPELRPAPRRPECPHRGLGSAGHCSVPSHPLLSPSPRQGHCHPRLTDVDAAAGM